MHLDILSNKGCECTFIMNRPSETDRNVTEGLYRFKAPKSKEVYLIRVEYHPNNFYVVKFHLKKHQFDPNKYNRLTHNGEATRIIHTCIKLMLQIASRDSRSSFAFIGSNTIDKGCIESEVETKRFKTYRYVMISYFSDVLFEHKTIPEKSTYIMLRKSELYLTPNLVTNTELYLADFYSDAPLNAN